MRKSAAGFFDRPTVLTETASSDSGQNKGNLSPGKTRCYFFSTSVIQRNDIKVGGMHVLLALL